MTVEIEKFEAEPGLRRIHAAIIVDRDAHKAMVIGKGGERLKRIATEARLGWKALRVQGVSRNLGQGQERLGRRRARAQEPRLRISPALWHGRERQATHRPAAGLRAAQLYPYRETSLIVEVFSRDHGRIGPGRQGCAAAHVAAARRVDGLSAALDRLERRWRDEDPRPRRMAGRPALLGGQALLCAYYPTSC